MCKTYPPKDFTSSTSNRLAPAALVLNLAAVPLSGFVLLAGLGILMAALVSEALAEWLEPVAWALAHLLRRSGEIAHQWPALDVRTPGPSAIVLVAYLGDFKRKGWFVLGGAIAFGLSIVNFGISSQLWLSLVFLCCIGFSIVVSVALTNTLLQKLVTDQMRGRVMSMFMLSFIGALPIGNILAGATSKQFGPQYTLAGGGLVIVLIATGVMIFNRRLRELH